jgi:hypothetical protein
MNKRRPKGRRLERPPQEPLPLVPDEEFVGPIGRLEQDL